MHRSDFQRWLRQGGLAWLALGLLLGGCSARLDPLSERCLQALEYLEPNHGEIEGMESYAGPSGTAIAIRTVTVGATGAGLAQLTTCEFEAGERWRFTRMSLQGHALSEAELALVNAEFLLRDLDRHPERLSGWPASGGATAPPGVGAGPERERRSAGSRFASAFSTPLADRQP